MLRQFQKFSVCLGNTSAKKLPKTQQKPLYIMSAMASAYFSILPKSMIWIFCFLQNRRSTNLAEFTGKYLCWSHLLTKLQVSKTETSLKRDSSTNIAHEFSTTFLKTLSKEHLHFVRFPSIFSFYYR